LTVDDRPDQQDNRTIARRLVMELAQGCGDHSCRFKKPSGMGTNGGCRCIDKIEDALSRRSTVTPERREYDFNVVRVYCLRHPRTAMGYNAVGFLCGECRAAVTVFGPSEPTVTPDALTTCDGWTIAFNAYSAGTGYGAKHPNATGGEVMGACERYASVIFPHEVCDSGEPFTQTTHPAPSPVIEKARERT
jgi:hypothetical protein